MEDEHSVEEIINQLMIHVEEISTVGLAFRTNIVV